MPQAWPAIVAGAKAVGGAFGIGGVKGAAGVTLKSTLAYAAKTAIFTGLSYVAQKKLGPSMEGLGTQLSTGVDSTPAKRFVYGKTRVGGDIVFYGVSSQYWKDESQVLRAGPDENQFLHMVIELAGHSIESFTNPTDTRDTMVYINDTHLPIKQVSVQSQIDLWPRESGGGFGTDSAGVKRYYTTDEDYMFDGTGQNHTHMMFKFYDGTQSAVDADLEDALSFSTTSETWDSTKIGNGHAYVYIRAAYQPEIFSGMPQFTFLIKGKNDIYDPRSGGSTGYTTNPSLIASDYLTTSRDLGGIGEAYAQINETVLIASANECEGVEVLYEDNDTTVTTDFGADPTLFTATAHGFTSGDDVIFSTTGTLPTDADTSSALVAGQTYSIIVKSANTFSLWNEWEGEEGLNSPWSGWHPFINLSSDGSGTHTVKAYGSTSAGVTDDKYFIGGSFSSGETPAINLTNILQAMAGWAERINGLWQINAGEYTAPAMTITESEMRETPEIQLNKSEREMFNSVKAICRSPTSDWSPDVCDSVEAITKITVTPNFTSNAFTAASHGLINGDRVQIHSWDGQKIDDDNIPTGLVVNYWYYVIEKTTSTFKVSLTEGGAADTFSDNGSGTIQAYFDNYLSKDIERRTFDSSYALVSNQTLARRLSLISLLQTRQQVSAKVRCKMATAFAPVMDLKVGDSVRWIDAHKSFWETITAAVTADTASGSATITEAGHGLTDGDPLIFSSVSTSGFTVNSPYYVVNADTNDFEVAEWRGGKPILAAATTTVDYQEIQGKLFRVHGWDFVIKDTAVGINLDLIETTANIYTWSSGTERAPAVQSSITVAPPARVEALSGLAATSGTAVLYLKADGTVGSRVKLVWTKTTDGYILSSGHVDIDYRISSSKTFTADHTTETFTATAHGYSDGDRVNVSTTSALPAGLFIDTQYWIYNKSANDFQLTDYEASTTPVAITDNGTGTQTVGPIDDWIRWAPVPGVATLAYVTDVEDGQDYDFRARFRNAMGNSGTSDSVDGHTVVGKTAAPADPTSFTATSTELFENKIVLAWTNPTDLDLSHTEIWMRDTTTADPEADAALIDTIAGESYNYYNPKPNDTKYFWIRAVDTTGNPSGFVAANASSGFSPTLKNFHKFDGASIATSASGEVDANKRLQFNIDDGTDTLSFGYVASFSATATGGSGSYTIALNVYDSAGSLVSGDNFASGAITSGTTIYVDNGSNIVASAAGGYSTADGYTLRFLLTTNGFTTMRLEEFETFLQKWTDA